MPDLVQEVLVKAERPIPGNMKELILLYGTQFTLLEFCEGGARPYLSDHFDFHRIHSLLAALFLILDFVIFLDVVD